MPSHFSQANELMDKTKKEFYSKRAQRAVEALNKNNIPAVYVEDRVEALEKLTSSIPDDASIGMGDSESLVQIGLPGWLDKERDNGRTVYSGFKWFTERPMEDAGPEGFREICRKAMLADVFLTGANAITLDGKVVSVDDEGNRVAATLFGPKRTYLVVGANKVVHNLEEAIKRCKDYATPATAIRHHCGHDMPYLEDYLPCQTAGFCPECKAPHKACRKWVILDGQASLDFAGWNDWEQMAVLTHVIMVGEELGI